MSKNDPKNALRALRGIHDPMTCITCGKPIAPTEIALTRNDKEFCCSNSCEHKKWPGGMA